MSNKSNTLSYKFIVEKKNLVSRSRLFSSAIIAGASSMMFGLSISIFEELCKKVSYYNSTEYKNDINNNFIKLSENQMIWLISILPFGGLFTNLTIGIIKRRSRKKMLLANLFYFVGNGLLCTAKSFFLLSLGQILIGFATGISFLVVPQYLCVIAPENIRGSISSFNSAGVAIGVLLGCIMNCFYKDALYLKHKFVAIMIFIVFHSFLVYFMENIDNIYNDEEYSVSLKTLLTERRARKSILTVLIVNFGQHLSCIYAVCSYLDYMVVSEHNTGHKFLFICISGVVGEITSILFLVDNINRKLLLSISAIFCAIGLFLFMYMNFKIISLCFYAFGFNIGLGPLIWPITCEVFPLEFVFAGSTIGVGFNWVANILVSYMFPKMYEKYGKQCLWFYIFCMFFVVVYFLGFYRETRRKRQSFQ